MAAPCGRRAAGHRHTLTWLTPGPAAALQPRRRRRSSLTDRCNSALLWSTAARAVLLEQDPVLDGKPLRWDPAEARAYLQRQSARWLRGVPAP